MNPALRHSAAHVFVGSLVAPVLEPDDLHHLARVLRVRSGETITMSDGHGSWCQGQLQRDHVVVTSPIEHQPEPPLGCVVSAIPKGDRVDLIVQKLTEFGVAEIVLADMDRSVVRWTAERLDRQRGRLNRVMREAASQSRRVWLPTLVVGESFQQAMTRPGAVLADPDGEALDAVDRPRCVIVGPEGGFSERELGAPIRRVRLADLVLRVETAAVLAAVRVGISH